MILLEKIEQAHREQRLRTDWEYAMEYFNVSKAMTVEEFAQALKRLQNYGWDISADELLETIKG